MLRRVGAFPSLPVAPSACSLPHAFKTRSRSASSFILNRPHRTLVCVIDETLRCFLSLAVYCFFAVTWRVWRRSSDFLCRTRCCLLLSLSPRHCCTFRSTSLEHTQSTRQTTDCPPSAPPLTSLCRLGQQQISSSSSKATRRCSLNSFPHSLDSHTSAPPTCSPPCADPSSPRLACPYGAHNRER